MSKGLIPMSIWRQWPYGHYVHLYEIKTTNISDKPAMSTNSDESADSICIPSLSAYTDALKEPSNVQEPVRRTNSAAGRAGLARKQIRPPSVGATPSEAVQHGMNSGKSADVMAPKVGMEIKSYRYIRKLLILKDDPKVSHEEKATIVEAIMLIDKTLELEAARKKTRDIVSKHWSPRTRTGMPMPERRTQDQLHKLFDNVIFHIREMCASNEDLKIPPLDMEERLEAVKSLNSSILALSILLEKVIGAQHDHQTEL